MYAPLPTGTTFETLTLAQAEAALEAAKQAKEGIQLGMWEGAPILKKKGPYGLYASWTKDDVKLQVPIKAGDSLEAIEAKLLAKRSDETCKVGDFTIKKGPFGYYCFNHTLKKAIFVKWPADTDFKTATAEQVSAIYTSGIAAKRSGGWKWKRGGKK